MCAMSQVDLRQVQYFPKGGVCCQEDMDILLQEKNHSRKTSVEKAQSK